MASRPVEILDGGLARLTLGACVFLANILWVICILPPNPTAESPTRNGVGDHLHIPAIGFKILRYSAWTIFTLASIVHGALIYTYASPPQALCPQSSFAALANPTMFTWNIQLALLLVTIGLSAAIRIAAFRNLGVNFTFNLKQPSGLVKTGIHGYMQHPSYTGAIPIISCILFIHLRFDGPAACYLPADWVESLVKLQPLLLATAAAILVSGAVTRVTDEEKMLKRAFGKEWEEYHRTTKRFVPGIF